MDGKWERLGKLQEKEGQARTFLYAEGWAIHLLSGKIKPIAVHQPLSTLSV